MDLKQAEAIQKLIPLLQSHEAFVKSNFPSELIPEFAQQADIQFAWQGSPVIKQGDEDKRFFVVISGELKAVDTNSNRLLNYLHPGDIFGMRATLRSSPRAATVEAVNDAVLAVYEFDDWNWLISQEPGIGEYFENIERRYDHQAEAAFPGLNLQADEVIVRAVKRHFLAFMATLTWPIAILIIPVLFLIGTELVGISLISTFSDPLALMIIVPFVVLAALVILYNYLDWQNDDLIVTTKRVIHLERVLFFGEERFEVPLTQVQNVTVISHGWLDLFFDVDDIEIKTAAAGTITVDNIASAQELSRIILTEQLRAKERAVAADTAAVRRQINDRLKKNVLSQAQAGGAPAPKVVPASRGISLPTIKLPDIKANYFWPGLREVTKVKGEEGILWRKHYYILLQHVFLPALALIFSFYLLLTALTNLPYLDYLQGGGWVIELILALAVLASIFWYVWEYDDWRRDVYIVTNTKIIDVESSSFRLKGEQLREGSFDSIQNITYTIPNFFYKLLNLGDVVIETAGAGKTFTFSRVLNPSSVQAEIFRRWDVYQQRKRDKQRDDTTKQILSVLGEYHDLTNPPAQSSEPAKKAS